jgi:hypothetical protein
MNWPNFLAPWWGLLGLLAIPIVALYILRQKRPDQPISSTLLWNKVLADMRASTPFQKLRRNLLLLLQLLILAALVLTLMRPVVRAEAGHNKASVIVIDCTASMQATDGGPAGQTRLERAKDEARQLVDTMRPGDRIMLLADGGGMVQLRSGFSTSKAELKQLLDQVKPSDTTSDLSESLLLAATSLKAIGSDKPGETAAKTEAVTAGKVWLFSDGAGIHVPRAMGEDNGLLQFVKIGQSANSVGITRLTITPVPKERKTYQVFAGLVNASQIERKVGVVLAFGTKDNFMPGQAKFVVLGPEAQGGVVFEKVVSDPGKLFVRVDDTGDDFLLDNTAYGILAPPRKVKVTLVTRGSKVLEDFVKVASQVMEVDGRIIDPTVYDPKADSDLVIFDGVVPPGNNYPKTDVLLIRPPGSAGGFKVTAEVQHPAVLRWKREDPVMQYVELGELVIGKSLLVERDSEAVELASSPEGPLIACKDFGANRRYFVAFSPLLESSWWRQPSLLIFLQNIVEQTRSRHFIGLPQIVTSGQAAKLWDVGGATGSDIVRIREPDGTEVEVAAKDGAAEFPGTDRVGFYEVDSAGRKGLFAVNLLSATESRIAPQSLQTGSGGNVEEAKGVASINKEVWAWLAAAALVVLLAEWYVYHRRIA